MIRRLILIVLMLCLTGSAYAGQDAPASRRAAATPPTVTAAAPVNINTATVAQLDALPGIGKATAERIVDYRQKVGGFKKTEELMNVQGIGEKSFLKLKPLVTVTMPRAERTTTQ